MSPGEDREGGGEGRRKCATYSEHLVQRRILGGCRGEGPDGGGRLEESRLDGWSRGKQGLPERRHQKMPQHWHGHSGLSMLWIDAIGSSNSPAAISRLDLDGPEIFGLGMWHVHSLLT